MVRVAARCFRSHQLDTFIIIRWPCELCRDTARVLSHPFARSHTQVFAFDFALTQALSRSHASPLSLSFCLSLLSLSQTHTHPLSLTHAHTQALSLTHTHSHALSLSHTHPFSGAGQGQRLPQGHPPGAPPGLLPPYQSLIPAFAVQT